MKKLVFFFIAFILFAEISIAQRAFEINAGLILPQSNYGEDDLNYSFIEGTGHASIGASLGIKYLTPLKVKGLSLNFNINAIFNLLSNDYRDQIKNNTLPHNIKVVYPYYLNFPIFVGINYKLELQKNFSIYGEIDPGLNIFKITNITLEGNNYNEDVKFEPSYKFAYSFSGGFIFNEKFKVGINYFNMGNHKVRYESHGNDFGQEIDDKGIFSRYLKLRVINITMGLVF